MCQACLALARRKSGASGWPFGDSEAAASPGRFAAAAESADDADDAQPDALSTSGGDDPSVDARRS